MSMLAARHDPEADAVWIKLQRGVYAATYELDSRRLVDQAADGTALSVELLDVSDGVDVSGLPASQEIEQALRRLGIRILQPAT